MDIKQLDKIHSIGHGLQDVKVSFNHDIKLDVTGVALEGKQGEILNVPRWVADVLEKDNLVELQDTDMVVELKQAIVKENVQGEFDLATLDDHFYSKLKSHMLRLSESDYNKVESMLNSLVRKRQGKIIRLADSSKLSADITQKLSIEEKRFYNEIYETSVTFKNHLLGNNK